MTSADKKPFWQTKKLSQMSPEEWESLCDGCAKCCLEKLEDVDTGTIFYTDVACQLLDCEACQCKNYPERQTWVPTCVILSPDNIDELHWMPSTCAYRLLAEGKDLPRWHPLVTGNPDSTHKAGQSVRGLAVADRDAGALEDHIVSWPE